MAGSITISSITLDSDNNFSIKSNTGATLFFANTTGIDVANSLPSSSITNDKIVSVANTKISGNIVSSQITSVANTQITGNLTATNIAGGSNGTIPYQSAAGITQMLAAGTSGQLLKSNGAAAPTWVTPSAGALVHLSTVTASAAATVDIETTFNGTYDSYLLIGKSCSVSVNTADFRLLMKLGGTYVTSNYIYHAMNSASGSTAYAGVQAVADSYIPIGPSMSNDSNSSLSFAMRIYDPTSTTLRKLITFEGAALATSGTVIRNTFGSGTNNEITALTGIRFFPPSGTISGTFRLYGIANS